MADSSTEQNMIHKETARYKEIVSFVLTAMLASGRDRQSVKKACAEMLGLLLEASFVNGRYIVIMQLVHSPTTLQVVREKLNVQLADVQRQIRIIEAQLKNEIDTIQ